MSTGHWLVSARFDLGLLIGPALLAALIALILPAGVEVGPLGFLVLVVGIGPYHEAVLPASYAPLAGDAQPVADQPEADCFVQRVADGTERRTCC